MSTDPKAEPDFTLEDLWEEGVEALQEKEVKPGMTYQVHPDFVGTMPYPTLEAREAAAEIDADFNDLFREEATAEDFKLLAGKKEDLDEEELEGAQSPIREDVTVQEWHQTNARVNCKKAARLLDFDEEVTAQDIVPEMASVIASHFTSLGPKTPSAQGEF